MRKTAGQGDGVVDGEGGGRTIAKALHVSASMAHAGESTGDQ
jgi:hypothetical protein